jgi:hypothetical protein
MNTIICKNCGLKIEIDKALEGQIEAQVVAAEHKKHEAELAKVKSDARAESQRMAEAATEQVKKDAADELEITKKRLEASLLSSQKKAAAEQEILIQSLRDDAKAKAESNSQLREQLTEIMKTLRTEKDARLNAELEAQKKVAAETDKIREQALQTVAERYHLKIAELEKKQADTQKALEDAQRKAAQGSQQTQGEVLELDLEHRLREEFPYDQIDEVKKGQRGADISQTVCNQTSVACGIILWETKNGKWQPSWIAKFKADIREANADIGVLVAQETPTEIGDMQHLEGNVWVVTPRLATRLAVALRVTILQVYSANKMNAGKDAKMEALYQFLVGPEFRHRVEGIVENYGMLQNEIEKEKRATALRWAHQEKAIRAVIDNTIGMYGDIQGITSRALAPIQSLEPETDDYEL